MVHTWGRRLSWYDRIMTVYGVYMGKKCWYDRIMAVYDAYMGKKTELV